MSGHTAIRPGELGIDVVADPRGRTRIAALRQRYPQRITAPLRSDAGPPHAATICIQSPSGGAFSDDDLHTTLRCAAGSHLRVTTQAATQVFGGDGPGARHRLEFFVAGGASLEFFPDTVIPHGAAAFHQVLTLDIETGGTYLGWDAVAPGRVAHGEAFAYTRYDSALTVRVDGVAAVRDRQVICPRPTVAPILVDGGYVATFLALQPGRDSAAVLDCVRRVVDSTPDCRGGAGRLPHGAGVIARLTATDAPVLHRVRRDLFAAAQERSHDR